ncbi:MAG: glycoside hydrolase family 99-like domain-containing protein [Armatimonadetes bacterium]|nr:glycoside hydrolase family 99-like domain-containing protein [Armatimonadota bacterium]
MANDSSGRGHNGKIIGAKWIKGRFGEALYFDGKARVEIPDSEELRLRGPISVSAWIKPDDVSTWQMIVRKENEYQLRISPPQEGNNSSFFVFLNNAWEPRINNSIPEVGKWHHFVGVWTGERLILWYDGEPEAIWRLGRPTETNNPVLIGSGFVGAIDEVRIYQRALTWDEILVQYLGKQAGVQPRMKQAKFEFTKGINGWNAVKNLTEPNLRNGLLTTKTLAPDSLFLIPPLEIETKNCEFISIRMSADKGRNGCVFFSTDKGFDKVAFELRPDGKMHTYNVDLAASTQWEGKLLRVGIIPSDISGADIRIQSIAFVKEVTGIPDLPVERCYLEQPINRIGRPCALIAVVRNFGGAAKNLRIGLEMPAGIELVGGERSKRIDTLGFDEDLTARWLIRSNRLLQANLRLRIKADNADELVHTAPVKFTKPLELPKANYVPEPRLVRPIFEVGVKYFPGWDSSSRWAQIMPFPERMPLLSWYREGDPEVADWHIKWAVEHGITFFFYDWYWVRGHRFNEHALHDGLLRARYRNYIKFAIHWANHNPPNTSSEEDLLNVVEFWLKNYFHLENYLKFDGKPVVGIFTPERLTEDMGSEAVRKAFEKIRERIRADGFPGVYIIARAHGTPTKLKQLQYEGYDAVWVTPDLRIGLPVTVNSGAIEAMYELNEKHWADVIARCILHFFPMPWSGWDSRPWHGQNAFVRYGLTPEVFKAHLVKARETGENLVGQPKAVIIWAWNEWGEGSYIEPHREFGFGYLDAIREVFTDAPKEHLDLTPEDVGLGPYDVPEPKWQTEWEFNTEGDFEGWDGGMQVHKLQVKGGFLRGFTAGYDPALFGPPIRATQYPFVIVRMRTTKDDIAQLYWTTRSIPESEATCYRFKVIGDNQFHEYKLPVHTVRTWRGTIIRLRLDPANQPNVQVSVDYIRLAK